MLSLSAKAGAPFFSRSLREDGPLDAVCCPLGCCTDEYGLSNRQSTDPSDRAVDSRGVLMHTNHRLQHFWRRTCRIGIKVNHRAADVTHRDRDSGRVVVILLAE